MLLKEVRHLFVGVVALDKEMLGNGIFYLILSKLINLATRLVGVDSEVFGNAFALCVPDEVVDGGRSLLVVDIEKETYAPTVKVVDTSFCLVKSHIKAVQVRVNPHLVVDTLAVLKLILERFVKCSRVRQNSKVYSTSDTSHKMPPQ
jgi:hypothetical protein